MHIIRAYSKTSSISLDEIKEWLQMSCKLVNASTNVSKSAKKMSRCDFTCVKKTLLQLKRIARQIEDIDIAQKENNN